MTTNTRNEPDVDPDKNPTQLLESAQKHANLAYVCLHEVTPLLDRLRSRLNALQNSGLPTFTRALQREYEALKSLINELSSPDAISKGITKAHAKRLEASTSTITRSVAQWDRLKRCRNVVAINQSFQGSSRDDRKREMVKLEITGRDRQEMHRRLKEQGRVEVDVVDGGREWLAVKASPRHRLARELTDSGWAWGDHELGDDVDHEEWDEVPVAKFAKRLVAAARMNRHEYRFPRIRLVLANLNYEGDDLDIFVDQLKRLDPLVELIIEYQNGPFMSTPAPAVETALDNLVGDGLDDLTSTINLDHTILIDLISDLTHSSLQPQPWQAPTTRAQIEDENSHTGGMMAPTLYPLLAGRKLVCTSEAADHFHNVLATVGTETERERGRLLVPWDTQIRGMPTEAIRKRFQELSIHKLPEDVQVPLNVVTEPWDMPAINQAVSRGELPEVALDVARCSAFKSSKLSIFMYGWAAGVATLTSNKEVRGQMRTWVEANRRSETEVGPSIWKLDVTRNLLAKNASPRPGGYRKVKKKNADGSGSGDDDDGNDDDDNDDDDE
ncbi:hypothetical protein BGZ63DRAFT_428554 [Mariannaea sp. PMI_226]|nr:hypothetical protein BGZ63DRAFT_428554 [Mariannaea sp. PMI_226]